jgi:hypothetical protein
MRKWKLAATATVASGVLAGGMFAAFSLAAKAQTAPVGCSASYSGTVAAATPLTCPYDAGSGDNPSLQDPESIILSATTDPSGLDVTFNWSSDCEEQNDSWVKDSNGTAGTTESSGEDLTLDYSALGLLDLPLQCDFDVTGTISDDSANKSANYLEATSLVVDLSYTQSVLASPSASPSSSPTPATSASSSPPSVAHYYNQVHGFDGVCLDDKGNSSAKRAAIIIWTCNNTDQAQGWSYSSSELKIHGMCLNAKGNGKSGSKLILWSCTGSGNEIFSHRSNGEYAEKANGYKMCIDDPAYSTKNGTQLFVYSCNNGANQHWSKP